MTVVKRAEATIRPGVRCLRVSSTPEDRPAPIALPSPEIMNAPLKYDFAVAKARLGSSLSAIHQLYRHSMASILQVQLYRAAPPQHWKRVKSPRIDSNESLFISVHRLSSALFYFDACGRFSCYVQFVLHRDCCNFNFL